MSETNYHKHQLPPELERALESLGFEKLTPIQAGSFPPLRAGKDLVGESQTGSGKTIAFGIPLLEKIDIAERRIQALVLCPTRELSDQVAQTIRSVARFKKDLLVCTLVGGEPIFHQVRSLRHGVHVVVGTPGRILDLLGRQKLDFTDLKMVVLDEADRMLDMGFSEALGQILEVTPENRQTVLFSATFPPEIESIRRKYQREPVRVTISSVGQEKPAITQTAYAVNEANRMKAVTTLLRHGNFESAIVFCNQRLTVDEVNLALRESGLPSDKIHGNLEQADRDRVMARFRNGSTRILVATDVAARGLDIAGLDAVINLEPAREASSHVHRIGRTGRAGKSGTAFTLFTEREQSSLARIEALHGRLPRGHWEGLADNMTESVALETIEISGGRRDKLRAGDILGALTGEGCKLPGNTIGKIDIKDNVSYVAVQRPFAFRALKALQAGKIKGRRFCAYMAHRQATH
jgi:ATP-independent RNA helicase DbpA